MLLLLNLIMSLPGPPARAGIFVNQGAILGFYHNSSPVERSTGEELVKASHPDLGCTACVLMQGFLTRKTV